MTGSAWTFNAWIVNNGSCCISPRISDQSSANYNTQRLATTETTEQHGNFNLFHFQNDQMWPVNMTGKTKGWPVNSQISPDIVSWPAVISSPGNHIIKELHCHFNVIKNSIAYRNIFSKSLQWIKKDDILHFTVSLRMLMGCWLWSLLRFTCDPVTPCSPLGPRSPWKRNGKPSIITL